MSLGNSPQAMPGSPTEPSPDIVLNTARGKSLKLTLEGVSEVGPLPLAVATPFKMKKANTNFTVSEPDDFAL